MSRRVVVITGAAGGIGERTAARFRDLGDEVIGLDITDGFDVRDRRGCEGVVAEIIGTHGRIDVLCNIAGIGAVGDVVAADESDWQGVFSVNVFGLAHMSAAVLPAMRSARSGVIVNVCSVAASVGLVERAVYSASKGAVLALTRAMAADEIVHGVRVNCVSPGTVSSPWVERLAAAAPDPDVTMNSLRRRQPLGRLVTCDEVADAIVYLAAPSTFTTGADFLLDGGITSVRIVEQS
ncbi:MAG: SDR family oxidoreductase [Actinobacteria bacterium]|nr:SDR family oxidoreductase [Actinomycetota bacterium]